MTARNKVFSMMLALGLLAAPAVGQARTEFEVTIAPPAERVEVVPAPREGYIYERGYWGWDGQRYNWQEGRFITNREGHRYVPHEWRHEGDKWRFSAGHWDDD